MFMIIHVHCTYSGGFTCYYYSFTLSCVIIQFTSNRYLQEKLELEAKVKQLNEEREAAVTAKTALEKKVRLFFLELLYNCISFSVHVHVCSVVSAFTVYSLHVHVNVYTIQYAFMCK